MESRGNLLTMRRNLFALLNYYGGYLYIYPLISIFICMHLFSHMSFVTEISLSIMYILSGTTTVLIMYPLLKKEFEIFIKNFRINIRRIFLYYLFFIFCNVVISIGVSLLSNAQTSVNQQEIMSAAEKFPILIFLVTSFFAPLIEELIFRGVIFLQIRKKFSFLVSAIVSGLMFGLLHMMTSFATFEFNDFLFLLLYSALGIILANFYEKSETLFVPIGVHFLNNFLVSLLTFF